MKELTRRGITALFFAAVMMFGILFSRISFAVLLVIIQTGCLYEYMMLIRKFQSYTEKNKKIAFAVTLLLSSAVLIYVAATLSDSISMAYAIFMIPVIFILLAAELFYQSATPLINGLLNACAVVYISLPLLCFYSLADGGIFDNPDSWMLESAALPLSIILIIWANDTFAYCAGTLFGKHKILPAVSPKKSWEGFIGGMIAAIAAAFILSKYYSNLEMKQWMILSLIIVVFGTMGDFFESMIKRQAGVKDSGNVFPGHGGFLDRFDALIFCLPFATTYIMLNN